MVKYALSMALILLLGTCGDRGAGPKTGRIALDVQDPVPPDEASGTVVQRVDRMVATVLQNETVVISDDLRYEGGVWIGELTVSTGSYSVVVEAYKGAIVKWRGSASVLVQGGESSRVVIALTSTNQVPVLADIGDQTIAEGRTLTILLVGSDADGDALTYAVEGPPAGSSLSGSTFTWEPSHTQAGEYSVTFTVADEHGGVARETITITVGETNQAPELEAIGDQTVAEGSLLTIPLVGTDEDGDALTYAVEGPPAGAALSGSTFTWEPSHAQAGEYSVTFTVADEHGGVAREIIIITVDETNQAPTLAAIGDQTVVEGSLLTITLDGTDVDGDALTYEVVDNPPGSSLSGATFRWQPSDTEEGMYQVTFRVEDEHGGQAVETIVITVQSRLRRLTNHSEGDGAPSWSPDGTQIAFQSYRDGDWNIYVMDADGSNLRRLTSHSEGDGGPSWSPDGTQIAFHSHRDGNWSIYVMDADGSNLRRLTNHNAEDGSPSWSPDGTQIAFHSHRDGDWNIYVMDADGSNLRQLTRRRFVVWNPSWSPDGTQIAFQSRRDENTEIYVIDADGSNLRRLTNHNAEDGSPSWSPDGTQIAFQSRRDGNDEIYVMDADGSNLRRLTSHSGTDRYPSWSPDGTQIAFQSRRDGNDEIYVLDLQWE